MVIDILHQLFRAQQAVVKFQVSVLDHQMPIGI